jgi:hypothetical protein
MSGLTLYVKNVQLNNEKDGDKVRLFNKSEIDGSIMIHWETYNDNSFYTIIIVDNDAPYPPPYNNNSPYLHYLITNVPRNEIERGNIVMNYISPNPPTFSPPHTYSLILLRQSSMIYPIIRKRENFDLQNFIEDNRLDLREQILFRVYSGDDDNLSNRSYITHQNSGNSISRENSPVRMLRGEQNFPYNNPNPHKSSKIMPNSGLNPRQEKYCECVLKVAVKNPGSCDLEKAWFEKRDGGTCYNPYAVCAKSTGTSYRHCADNYNWDNLEDNELQAYANLNKISIPETYSRNKLMDNIVEYKRQKYGK